MLHTKNSKYLQSDKSYLVKHPKLLNALVLFFGSLVAYLPLLIGRLHDRFFYAPTPHAGSNPCTLPTGSYADTCSQIDSKPIQSNQALCNFTAICDTGKGKYLSADAVNYYKYGQYGDKCASGLLYYQELQLPKYMQFQQFINERGFITNPMASKIEQDYFYRYFISPPEANFSFFAKVKTTEVEDQDCNIRRQLSTASNSGQDLAVTSIATLATLKMLV